MPILLSSPWMKWSCGERKLEVVVAVTLLLLSLMSYCKCQKEVCGTKTSEAIDVMWLIHTNNDIESSDFLVLKQFLSDMMLWFRISCSDTDETRHGCIVYSDMVQDMCSYESSVTSAQKNFIDMKPEKTTDIFLYKALDYLVKNTVASDRQTVPNVAVVVTTGEPSPTANTITAATELTKAGWNIIFLVVTSKVDRNKMQRISSELQLHEMNYYTVGSYRELKSLEFQEQFAKAVCGYDNFIVDIKSTKMRLRRNSDLEETKVRLRRNSDLEKTKVRLRRNGDIVQGYVNVAKKKPAKQSSTNDRSVASLAADGIVTAISCTDTGTTAMIKKWWEVDLKDKYDIEYVSVTLPVGNNQFDIIGHNGYTSDADLQNSRQLCGSSDNPPTFTSILFKCSAILDQKRYLQVQEVIADFFKSMKLCEVEVFAVWPPGYYNVAEGKPTSQSSRDVGASDLAVDEKTDPGGSCAQTQQRKDVKEWWQVDLKQVYDIVGVTIFNSRKYWILKYFDISAFEELIGFDKKKVERCGGVIEDFFITLKHFPCELLQKRYIQIEQSEVSTDSFLYLCEVEVWTGCQAGNYGRYCKELCNDCGGGLTCDKITGQCPFVAGTTTTTAGTPVAQTSSNSGAIAGAVVSVLLVLAGAAVGGAFYYQRRRKRLLQGKPDVDPADPDEFDPDAPPVSFKWLWEKNAKENAETEDK